ncbi:MAG: hypothetical protein LBW77_01835, partial [Verrucomicrobiota bacterium]|nr:hypothetical protein [Verrucomicrobiota bacterium]
MFSKQITTLAAVAGLTAFGAYAQGTANLQDILQRLEALNRQNEELRQKVLQLEQNQAKQETDVAAVKTAVAAVPPATGGAGLAKPADKPGISFKPYGWIKLDAAYDSHQTIAGDATLFVKPLTDGASHRDLTFGARESRFGTYIYAPEFNGFKVTGRLEGDWYGNFATADKYELRFRLAYFDVAWGDGWTARFGQDWDTYNTFHPLT